MNLSKFFIDRPIFAGVISVAIFLIGLISMFQLPISEYPEVVPPSVVVSARFPGANPKVVAETIATPLEEQINGVEDMLYMFSQAASDGSLTLTVTFKLGVDANLAQQLVQNRVNQALPRLPEITRQIGVTTVKSSPDLTMVVHLRSPNNRYDVLYLRNYGVLNVKDRLARIPGVGRVALFGAGDYAMRVWLNPQKIAQRGLTANDVVSAIRRQNVQVAAGVIGGPPYKDDAQIQLTVDTRGRLSDVEDFEKIIIKRDHGVVTRLSDVARLEIGAADYGLRSLLNNQSAVAVPIFQSPGANAIEISDQVRKTMAELQKTFPDGIEYSIAYDPTVFVRGSIEAVVHTLIEAIILVVIVVILFLQTWRASIIPLLAVPVSIVGTFAAMHAFGFSINALSLFGLVLAIGIVVDDAIVVVENVERSIENGLKPREAAIKAMSEVTGPIIAIALVLCAVFIPIAFVSGLTGQFYRQFALTIAFSSVISAFNSLTLSPALSALLLKDHNAPKDGLSRLMDKAFGRPFAAFNRFFHKNSDRYSTNVGRVLGHRSRAFGVYLVLIVLTVLIFRLVPSGFVPVQDKQYLIGFAQLPDGATLDRTEKVIREMSEIALNEPGVESAVAFPGLSINGFINSSSAGIVFVTLKPFEERHGKDLSGIAISQKLQQKFFGVQNAFIAIFPPPPVHGLGTIGGFKLQVEDRTDQGFAALNDAIHAVVNKARQTPALGGVFTSYNISVPQLFADVDRTKAMQLGVDVQDIFDTMQVYLGSFYINDFNKFGRTYQVVAQADKEFRSKRDDVLRLETRNAEGRMVPLGAMLRMNETSGPDNAMRYNGFRSADLNGSPAPGYSSGQAQSAIVNVLKETLPQGMSYEWTEITYQQILAGNTGALMFLLCVLLVFLVLAAQYESLFLPLAIILIVPMGLLSAIAGVWLTRGDNNMFTQIGLFVLVGLACKNAILIVERARELEHLGQTTVDAAIEAARLRLRPILMTSFAFIMGVVPLVISSGAGSEMRHAMGVAVFFGMLGVTFFGLFLTPVFYVILRGVEKRVASKPVGAKLILLLTVGLALTTGCISPVKLQKPTVATPTQWQHTASSATVAGSSMAASVPIDQVWWQHFEDPTLNTLIQEALTNNNSLAIAKARVEEARAARGVTRAALMPQINGVAGVSRGNFGATSNDRVINLGEAGFDASWELDLFGHNQARAAQSQALFQSEQAQQQAVQIALLAEVARAYFDLRDYERQLEITRKNLENQQKTLDVISAQFTGAIASDFDVQRAGAQVSNTQSRIPSLHSAYDATLNRLNVLLGVPPGTKNALFTTRAELKPLDPQLVVAAPAAVLGNRPDVRAAERRLAASLSGRRAAISDFFPRISLLGFYGVQTTDRVSYSPWNAAANLVQPLLNFGLLRSQYKIASARQKQAFYNYQQVVLEALENMENSLSSFLNESDRNGFLKTSVVQNQKASTYARQQFEGGFIDLLDVLISERTVLDAESALADSDAALRKNLVNIYTAAGGGWNTEQPK